MRAGGIPLKRRTKGHHAGRSYKPRTQEEVEYLLRRRLAGETSESIAHDLDRSLSAVSGMIQTLRREDVTVAMRGQGVRRLWDAEALKSSLAGRYAREEVELAAVNDRVN
jgi:hypothetical protein